VIIADKYCELFADTPNYLATCSKYIRPNSPKWNLNTQTSGNTKINTILLNYTGIKNDEQKNKI